MHFLPNDSKWYQSLASVRPAHRYWYTLTLVITALATSYTIYSYFLYSSDNYHNQLQAVQKQLDAVSVAQTHIKQLEAKKLDQLKQIEQHKSRLQEKQIKDVIALIQESGITLEKCSFSKHVSKRYYDKLLIEVYMTATIEQLSMLSKKLADAGLSLSDISMSQIEQGKAYRVTANISLYKVKV